MIAGTEHACDLTRTNSYGIVPVCSCGWIGSVHQSHVHVTPGDTRGRRIYDTAERRAYYEHARHIRNDGPLRATVDPASFASALVNTRRFGHA